MPIRIFSLPGKDLQYALNCMDIYDLIAFSLCSKRSKNLVKSSNRKIHLPTIYVYENWVQFYIRERALQREDREIERRIFQFNFHDKRAELACRNGIEGWKKEFTQNDWIAHFMSTFNHSMIHTLGIMNNTSLSYLDTIKQFFPKFHKLLISGTCSREFIKVVFWKLYSIAEEVEFERNIFDDENDKSKFLTQNFKSVTFGPLKLTLDDLLTLNIADLTINFANISEKELNRFLKLWMKGNHIFYRPKAIRLCTEDEIDISCEEVLKGIKYEDVQYNNGENFPTFRLRRGDGKEMKVFIADNEFVFRVG